MAQPNLASTPHGFVHDSIQAPKTRPTRLGTNCLNMPWLWTLFFRCGMLQSPHLKKRAVLGFDTICKTRLTPPCRIFFAMAQPNSASTPHGFVPGSPQAPKTRPTKLGINCFNMPWFWTLFFRCRMLQSPHLKKRAVLGFDTICKTRLIPPCRIFSAMAQPNPAYTPHGFIPSSPQAPKRILQG